MANVRTHDPLTAILIRLQGARRQSQLAEELGLSEPLISQFFHGVKRPGRYVARCIVQKYPELTQEVKLAFLNLESLGLDEGPPAD